MTDQNQDEMANVDENEIVSEASMSDDPKNAETASVTGVAKAANVTTKQSPPKTKAGMINAVMAKMQNMSKAKLQASYGGYMSDDVNAESFEGEAVAEDAAEYDFSGDLNALVESEATLSDGFKDKAATIFEAAVKSKLSEEISRIEESYSVELAEEIASTKSDLVEKIDSYLNYVVENWMKENQIAIQSGLRAEIAENFMNGLKDLFVESYVDVPEAKEDLVDDLAEQVEELETALNSQTAKNIEMTEELELFQRYEVIREHAHGLAETEVEKLAKLAEDLDYIDEETFSAKVKTIKDSYFTKEAKTLEVGADLVEETTADAEVSSSMDVYLQALRKTS
ncbi:hypothetical protein N8455_00125 [Candidatus Gracilibacteria bacterium]|nr:hypothetical protein [Candidatus Gracilibacteria bacterium]|tara:strand:- start:8 stop:1027 length:1020 start_codon:yes stop_codon:yes gene_type:complete